ncbi:UDP-N-acetylmuramoyl-L-alanine--D-glutamate ligase [Hydrogenophaga sp. IBVHS2]|uniref:UDP-N-acetylmuramoyl-L-alanine--D-glutamate ligase n=1 Tax=Hydrogenophaga sp. IBVHS2 TaxID=1985170 RepID=UPI000A2DAF45|nr:UDP-N-acetylmuramoyl-L-alanine--D-glutamate ligase [Hydrogenophaga sp. IBVHS2]OSZ64753.1 UDP-N-acetylmuramoyl-L-alanine--D-glutamate ligase [Hydrogenophaga sp. IBVHS2]
MHDQNVLILGLGISGLAMARWCTRQGARVTVADTRPAPPQLQALRERCPQAGFVAGPLDGTLMQREAWTLVARSPGLSPDSLAVAREWTATHGVPLLGELDLFAQALQALGRREEQPYRPQVLAITGTNGKTTVTSLTGLLLQRAGQRVAVAGNIGPALLDVLADALDAESVACAADAQRQAEEAAQAEPAPAAQDVTEPPAEAAAAVIDPEAGIDADADPIDDEPLPPPADTDEPAPPAAPLYLPPPHLPTVWVLELSSFQLDGTAGGAWDSVPTAATVLNITEDHLDWHGSMAAYAQAKRAIHGSAALMVLNRDDPTVMGFQPPLVTVKVSNRNRQVPARPWSSFGLDAPTRPGDWGVETVNGMAWLVRAVALDETRARGRQAPGEDEVYLQRLMPVDALRIRGRHNAANALAALALATSTGAALAPMLHGLREYRGEPHRVEPVGIVGEVEYFDDSKGTNVGATLAAVTGLGADRRLVVILGGDGKGQDFVPLAAPLVRHARAVVLIGRDAPAIRAAIGPELADRGVPLHDATGLPEAVRACAGLAQAGDAVLMSPACASLDMFDNYVHRARVFVDAVAALAAESGQSLEGAL